MGASQSTNFGPPGERLLGLSSNWRPRIIGHRRFFGGTISLFASTTGSYFEIDTVVMSVRGRLTTRPRSLRWKLGAAPCCRANIAPPLHMGLSNFTRFARATTGRVGADDFWPRLASSSFDRYVDCFTPTHGLTSAMCPTGRHRWSRLRPTCCRSERIRVTEKSLKPKACLR
jgi:hypothetical protein